MAEKYKGFGEEHTPQRWAELLNLRASLLRYCIESGRTIEETSAFFNITYKGPPARKPRKGYRIEETRRLVGYLLQQSGYDIGPGDLTVKNLQNAEHLVAIGKRRVGVYNYKTGWLGLLTDGDAIPLKEPYSEELKIAQDVDGFWRATPETQAKVRDELIGGSEEPSPEELKAIYEYNLPGPKAEPDLYEYKGNRFTCAEWARRLGIPQNTLWRRLKRGQTIEEIIAAREKQKVHQGQ